MDKKPAWPLLLLGVALVLWAGAFVAIRGLLAEVDPMSLTLLRFLLAAFAWIVIVGVRGLQGRLIRVPDKSLWPLLFAFGIFGFVGYHVALNFGEVTVPAGPAAVIVALSPAIVALLVFVTRVERVTPLAAAGIALAFVGVAVVSMLGHPGSGVGLSSFVGPAVVLISPTSWALSTLAIKRMQGRIDAVDMTAIGTFIGTILLLPFAPRAFLHRVWALSTHGWLLVAYLSLGATVFAYLAWNIALTRYRATNVTSTLYLVPPLATAMAWLLLGETVTVWFGVGTAAIIAGVAIVERGRDRRVLG